MIKYFLWIRWENGIKDCFEITKTSVNFLDKNWVKYRAKKGHWGFNTPTNQRLRIRLNKSVAWKIIKKEFNPLDLESLYDNPWTNTFEKQKNEK